MTKLTSSHHSSNDRSREKKVEHRTVWISYVANKFKAKHLQLYKALAVTDASTE